LWQNAPKKVITKLYAKLELTPKIAGIFGTTFYKCIFTLR
jgi:hypothetical protein